MRVKLEYGRTGLMVDLPTDRPVRHLGLKSCAPLADPAAALAEVLERPNGSAPLSQLARGRRSACIAICDITRPVPNALILQPMLATLEAAGIPREGITILVATGLHRPSTPSERLEMLGPDIVARYRIEDHRGQQLSDHEYLGASPRGVPIWIDRRYTSAELKLTVGLIEPHFMAGYSGGRKLICPGLAALETIRIWHGPAFLEHPRADIGCLNGNPVHEENTWIARRAGCDMIVNVIIDAARRPLKFVAGDLTAAFEEGVNFLEQVVVDSVSEPVDVVVTSAGGYPLDTTFYQAVKGLCAAAPIVKPGGTIVLAAGMEQGIGSSEFENLFREHASLDEFMARILGSDYFAVDQWQLEKLARVCRHARVKVVSDGIPAAALDRLFVRSAASVEKAVDESLADYGPGATLAVIPHGPYVVAQVARG